MKDILASFQGNPQVSIDALEAFHSISSITLPDDYVSFLKRFNGGEGFIGGASYLILWKIEELLDFNHDYEVKQYCPGIFLIGSSGGGEAYGFDQRRSTWPVIQVPFVGMDLSLVEEVSKSFSEFLKCLATGDFLP